MKVIGVLSWAQEKPAWLMAGITALAPILDHLIAVDGKYFLYPDALTNPASDVAQSIAVVEACAACNLALTLHRPNQPFMGNEVEKRNLTLSLAHQVKESERDWVIVFDGDHIARKFSAERLRKELEESDAAVATYALYEDSEAEGFTPMRSIYRLIDGLAYGPTHYALSIPSDAGIPLWLWGDKRFHQPYLEAQDLTQSLKFDHRSKQRHEDRRRRAQSYYSKRDTLGIERFAETFVQDMDGNWANVRDRAWAKPQIEESDTQ